MKMVRIGSKQFQKLINRDSVIKKRVSKSVSKIIDGIRTSGDEAVLKYTRKFDRV